MTKLEILLMSDTSYRRIVIASDMERYTITAIMGRFGVSRATAVRDRRAAADAWEMTNQECKQ